MKSTAAILKVPAAKTRVKPRGQASLLCPLYQFANLSRRHVAPRSVVVGQGASRTVLPCQFGEEVGQRNDGDVRMALERQEMSIAGNNPLCLRRNRAFENTIIRFVPQEVKGGAGS